MITLALKTFLKGLLVCLITASVIVGAGFAFMFFPKVSVAVLAVIFIFGAGMMVEEG